MSKLDWTDLSYVICVARTGSLSATARELGVNHSTVLRRITAFEQRAKVQLFIRDAKGYRLSAHGQSLLKDLEPLSEMMDHIALRFRDYDTELEGKLSVTTTVGLFQNRFKDAIFRFTRSYPGIRLELLVSDDVKNLGHLESDIALRPTDQIADGYFGEKLCEVAFHIYGQRDLLASLHSTDPFTCKPWVGLTGTMADGRLGQMLAQKVDDEQVALRANSLESVGAAVEAGIGLGILPTYIAERNPDLVQVSQGGPVFVSPVFSIVRKELQTSRRVNAFMNFIAKNLTD